LSSLSDRIRGIVKPSPDASLAQPFRAAMPEAGLKARATSTNDLEQTLGGTSRDGCLVVERQWKPTARHGREAVGALAEKLVAASDDATLFAGGAPARPPFVFFDLETTGLNGGAGTLVFLVGCGWFDEDRFVTRQFVLTRYAHERTLLQLVAGEIGRAGAIVSFNGKSFDAPLLETRYLFHRLPWFGGALPHVDVLHPARQFWKHDDCSLAALEQRLIGHRRARDVAGFEVPARYFQFVRSGDAQPLCAVLEHNRLDLLSLAALTARLLHAARSGPDAAADAREALALGHLYARAGLDDRARDAYARSVSMSRAPNGAFDAVKIEGLRALAVACRRGRRFEEAARCWQALLAIRGCPPAVAREAAEALAIHHEHRIRDLMTARSFALETLQVTEELTAGKRTDAVLYRLARLDRKLERQRGTAVARSLEF